MLINDIFRAFGDIFTSPLRRYLLIQLALSLVVLAVLWWIIGTFAGIISHQYLPQTVFAITSFLIDFGLIFILGYFFPTLTIFIGFFFLDAAANRIENIRFPEDPPGKTTSFPTAILNTLTLILLSIGINILALFLLLVPGINLIAFWLANALLFGREFRQFATHRYAHLNMPSPPANDSFITGLIVAFFLTIPFLNLLTPLFAAAFYVYRAKSLHNTTINTPDK